MKSDSPEMMSKRRQLIKLFSPAVMAFLLFSLGAVTFLVVQEAVPLDSSERVRVQRRSVGRDCRMLQNTSKEKDEDYLNALIQSHLQICSNAEATPAFPLANTVKHISQSYKSQIADSMQALYTFIPRNFSPNFRNPCWYDSLQVPQTLYRRLTHYAGPLPHTELQYSDKQAAEIMETVLSIRANRTSIFSYLGTKSSVLPNVPASSKLYCLPPILLAGFPKCATSTLHNMLLRHRKIVPTMRKENQFWREFFHPTNLPHKQLKVLYYLHWMQRASKAIETHPDVLTLDASTTTVYAGMNMPIQRDSDICIVPRIISEILPGTKVIVMMRNPVDRLYSDFWYLCSKFTWQTNPEGHFKNMRIPDHYLTNGTRIFHHYSLEMIRQFKECLQRKSEFECARAAGVGYAPTVACNGPRLGLSLYYFHIVKWMSVLPQDQLLFLRTEDLLSNPLRVMMQVWQFLGVPFPSETEMRLTHKNENTWIKAREYKDSFHMHNKTREMLTKFFWPYNVRLASLLKDVRFLWQD